VDDVSRRGVAQTGDQAFDIARTAVLSAGWPESVPGTTVDRQVRLLATLDSSRERRRHLGPVFARGQRGCGVDVAGADGLGSGEELAARRAVRASLGPGFPNQGIGA